MPYKLRQFVCIGCSRPVEKRGQVSDAIFCQVCGIERAAEAARQLHARSGPFYEAFLINRARAALAAVEAAGLGHHLGVICLPAGRPAPRAGTPLVGVC